VVKRLLKLLLLARLLTWAARELASVAPKRRNST
jgi:hypothetical protein